MSKQIVRVKRNQHFTEAEAPVIDRMLLGVLAATIGLAIIIIWGIGQALGF
ncbi:MAG: hypothetical protein PHT28_01975 [Dehalococcoidales bacterium]|nr:hypothetical protein [Dehalococcoidales bacterium]